MLPPFSIPHPPFTIPLNQNMSVGRLELPTNGLKGHCSTIELHAHLSGHYCSTLPPLRQQIYVTDLRQQIYVSKSLIDHLDTADQQVKQRRHLALALVIGQFADEDIIGAVGLKEQQGHLHLVLANHELVVIALEGQPIHL